MIALKGKALKRAMATKDAVRLIGDVSLIHDTTELITPETAQSLLKKNTNNRPINWNKVKEFSDAMKSGKWKFHAQGIILDNKGNILTGQKRLWAIIHSGIPQYMRVSRGSHPDTAPYIDRGAPQSARDLASRHTRRKHSPTESNIVRAILALRAITRPSADQIAEMLVEKETILNLVIESTARMKKTKAGCMILAVVCDRYQEDPDRIKLCGELERLADELELRLHPVPIKNCWNKGAAFGLAMDRAVDVVCHFLSKQRGLNAAPPTN